MRFLLPCFLAASVLIRLSITPSIWSLIDRFPPEGIPLFALHVPLLILPFVLPFYLQLVVLVVDITLLGLRWANSYTFEPYDIRSFEVVGPLVNLLMIVIATITIGYLAFVWVWRRWSGQNSHRSD